MYIFDLNRYDAFNLENGNIYYSFKNEFYSLINYIFYFKNLYIINNKLYL